MTRTVLFLVFLFLVVAGAFAQIGEREVVDRIVVVVGDQIILASEVASQMQLIAMQTARQPRTEQEAKEFRDEIVEQMINDRLFLIVARKDTTINIRPDEVDGALDDRIKQVSENFGSQEEFLAALGHEGMTLRDLRKKYRTEVENQLLKQRLIQSKLYTVSVSKYEVEQFYEKYSDSIPAQPEAVKLAHILLTVKPSRQVEDSVKTLANELRDRILNGADFATVSSEYSSLGAGANGGDLGFIGREDLVDEFARAAFNLRIGEISGVVRTQFGYHIIKAEDRRDDKLKLRHVLLAVEPSVQDTSSVIVLADSLIQVVTDGGSFEELAKIYSEDNDSRVQDGELGWFATDKMPPEFATSVIGWQEVGQLKGPITTQFGYHILKLLEYRQQKNYNLEEDFDQIKELARQDKTGRVVDEWVETIKAETYIDIRADE